MFRNLLSLLGAPITEIVNFMFLGTARFPITVLVSGAFCLNILAQTAPGRPPLSGIEPGLESAVKWKWRVVSSEEKDWGLELPTFTQPPPVTAPLPSQGQPESSAAVYEVKRGDALILIAKQFGVTVAQLKQLNSLKSDKILIGQALKIPSASQAGAAASFVAHDVATADKDTATESRRLNSVVLNEGELNDIRLQVFLDRQQFSAGPITGKPTAEFKKVVFLYQSTHEEAKDDPSLQGQAEAALAEVFTHYKLKREDFRFIAAPKAETSVSRQAQVPAPAASRKLRTNSPATTKIPRTYEQLMANSMMAYLTPWEFVAERFHCQESYLRALNGKLPAVPAIGAEFLVPNVIPFEIEKALEEPLQPEIDPQNPVTATIIGLSQLSISRGGKLVAVLPVSPARPGLHGRGFWTILDAIARPRLATRQEEKTERSQRAAPLYGVSTPEPANTPQKPRLSSEQYLAAGPRNPVGILWISLAKANSKEPLPYGLHGTSIPDQMHTMESIGGFRLTNWDVARAVRLLPAGTPLEWK